MRFIKDWRLRGGGSLTSLGLDGVTYFPSRKSNLPRPLWDCFAWNDWVVYAVLFGIVITVLVSSLWVWR